jgi:hypothetical protein
LTLSSQFNIFYGLKSELVILSQQGYSQGILVPGGHASTTAATLKISFKKYFSN